jgi:transcriptional regulator with XRE-family HTH domain
MPARKVDANPALRRLGDVIARHRIIADKSQESLAHAAGISERYLRTVERGRASPSYLVLLRIASALNTTLEDIVKAARKP